MLSIDMETLPDAFEWGDVCCLLHIDIIVRQTVVHFLYCRTVAQYTVVCVRERR